MSVIEIQSATAEKNCPSDIELEKWVRGTFSQTERSGEVVVRLVDKEEMRELNLAYRKKDKPTNVLSFASQLPPPFNETVLGDIVICAPIVASEALAQSKPLEAHWAHLTVHGVLHLLGYNHEHDEEALIMEALERTILNTLGYSDPYGVNVPDE